MKYFLYANDSSFLSLYTYIYAIPHPLSHTHPTPIPPSPLSLLPPSVSSLLLSLCILIYIEGRYSYPWGSI